MQIQNELHLFEGGHEITPEMIELARPRFRDLRTQRLRTMIDDVLVGRDLHGLEPRVARELQLAASAINHDRFHRLLAELANLLDSR